MFCCCVLLVVVVVRCLLLLLVVVVRCGCSSSFFDVGLSLLFAVAVVVCGLL